MNNIVKKWIEYGNNDLIIVENEMLMSEDRKVSQIIAFHFQQAVEKYLKAYLVYKEQKVLL